MFGVLDLVRSRALRAARARRAGSRSRRPFRSAGRTAFPATPGATGRARAAGRAAGGRARAPARASRGGDRGPSSRRTRCRRSGSASCCARRRASRRRRATRSLNALMRPVDGRVRAAAEVGERPVPVKGDGVDPVVATRGRGSARPCSPGPRRRSARAASSARQSVRSKGSSASTCSRMRSSIRSRSSSVTLTPSGNSKS